MDPGSHPAPFPQLKILRPFQALTASLSRCASVSPAWSLKKRSRHHHHRERNRSRRSTTSPPYLTVFPHVCLLVTSLRPTPPTPVKTVVRTPIPRRPRRSTPRHEGATGVSARLNFGKPPLASPCAFHQPPLDPSRRPRLDGGD
jgi:hypothetical protein